LQVKTTDVSRFSAWVLTGLLGLAFAACEDEKKPEVVEPLPPGPLKVETVISDPKVGLPGDTLLFTAVITSSSQNEGDYPAMQWSSSGGTFVESNQQSVRWVAPNAPGVFTITAKATNDVNTATGTTTVYVGNGGTLMTQNAGQINLLGGGPDFRYFFTGSGLVTNGIDVREYVGGVDSDPFPAYPQLGLERGTVFSPNGQMEAFAADTLIFATVRPRNIYVGTFGSGVFTRLTIDGARPASFERNQYSNPSFSPNNQVVAYQRLAQSWDGVTTDSFHVYIQDIVANKRTLVTYEHEYPRAFFPTFSPDENWLVYVVDRTRNGQWEIYGSPMSGNDVDGSLASLVRFTNTGGLIVTGGPRDIKRPPMEWNPVSSLLAVAAADNVLYLIQTHATGANVIGVQEVPRAQEIVWSASGALLAVAYFVTDASGTVYRIATVTTAGVATDRVVSLPGDNIRDLQFSPDEKWLLYRVSRGGGSWFSVVDIGAGKLTEPVALTATDPVGGAALYRGVMSLRPAWTSANLMIYLAWGTSSNNTPGIFTRDLNGLLN
jgi:hypothetical protein